MALSEHKFQESRRSNLQGEELQNIAPIKFRRNLKRVSYQLANMEPEKEIYLGSADRTLSVSKIEESADRVAVNNSTTKVFFKNVPKNLSVEEVTDLLTTLGPISHLRVPFSIQKAKNMGYGYVAFKEEDLNLWLISQNPAIYFLEKRIIFSKHQNSLKRIGKRNKKLENLAQSAGTKPKSLDGPTYVAGKTEIKVPDNRISLSYLPSTNAPEGGEEEEIVLHRFRPTQRNYFIDSGFRSELLHLSNNIRLRVLTRKRSSISTNTIARG